MPIGLKREMVSSESKKVKEKSSTKKAKDEVL
jgi:hypothetical protein